MIGGKCHRVLLVLAIGILHVFGQSLDAGHFLNEFAIRLTPNGTRVQADQIAKDHGFRVTRELKYTGIFILEHPQVFHRSKRSATNHLARLQNDPRISHAQQEVVLKRVKRRILHDKQLELPIREIKDGSIFHRIRVPSVRDNLYDGVTQMSDPMFKDMWYLVNKGQSGGERGLDLDVEVVWQNGITGKGVVVCILDDGIDHKHPDLKANYDPEASTDLNDKHDKQDDPMPDMGNPSNSHGTRCAGEIAASANNDVCGVGIAYNARIGGVRVLDGPVTDALEAEALTFNNQYVHIYSASWGPDDDGGTMEGPSKWAIEALQKGVLYGRGGLGSIFVWATGNGGMNGDDCSADGYVSRPETLSVGSVTDWGRSPFYMENCSSTLAVVPTGGELYRGEESDQGVVKLKVVTTDVNGGCIENFQGTSSAAPLGAGCLANVLEANPSLTWRDVQHIVVRGTRIPSVDRSWTINGAGHHVSHRFGFGLMDCGKMVELAQNWDLFPERLSCNVTRKNYQLLPRKGHMSDTLVFGGCDVNESRPRPAIDRLEHVTVHVKVSSEHRGDLALSLTSPAGTRSRLLSQRPKDRHVGDWEFTFMTVHSWDENPIGKWTLDISHNPVDDGEHSKIWNSPNLKEMSSELKALLSELKRPESAVGYLKEWSVMFYGTHGTRHDRTSIHPVREQRAYSPSEDDVLELKQIEIEISKRVKVKRNKENDDQNQTGSGSVDVGLGKGKKKSKKKTNKKSKFMAELWDALYRHGGRDVKKRVLHNHSSSDTNTQQPLITQQERDERHLGKLSRQELLIRRILTLVNEL